MLLVPAQKLVRSKSGLFFVINLKSQVGRETTAARKGKKKAQSKLKLNEIANLSCLVISLAHDMFPLRVLDKEKLLSQSMDYSAIILIHCFSSFPDSQQTGD